MPATKTEVTEVGTALGMLVSDRADPLAGLPRQLRHVSQETWDRFVEAVRGEHATTFETAFDNGRHFFRATDGLRSREPIVVEWKGPHRPPGDEVAPIDLRVDHVFHVSCKYLSKVLLNAGPARLFDRLMVGEERTRDNWFEVVAPDEYATFYRSVRDTLAPGIEAALPSALTSADRAILKQVAGERRLPEASQQSWSDFVAAVSANSATRWRRLLTDPATRLRLFWRMLRIVDSPYFVLGAARSEPMRLRVASKWDWAQEYELLALDVNAGTRGQPEVRWTAQVRPRSGGEPVEIDGHVEVRWSHGRFQGAPEAKVYLDTPASAVPGFAEF